MCMSVRMHVCVSCVVCVRACERLSVPVCMRLYASILLHACTSIYAHLFVHVGLCMCSHAHERTISSSVIDPRTIIFKRYEWFFCLRTFLIYL